MEDTIKKYMERRRASYSGASDEQLIEHLSALDTVICAYEQYSNGDLADHDLLQDELWDRGYCPSCTVYGEQKGPDPHLLEATEYQQHITSEQHLAACQKRLEYLVDCKREAEESRKEAKAARAKYIAGLVLCTADNGSARSLSWMDLADWKWGNDSQKC